MERNATDALRELVNDDRFNCDTQSRICGDNEAQVVLFSGHEDTQREIITSEFGLQIMSEERGALSGDIIATVVDPDGDTSEAPDVSMDTDDAISMF